MVESLYFPLGEHFLTEKEVNFIEVALKIPSRRYNNWRCRRNK